MSQDLKPTLGKLAGGEVLSADEAEGAFTIIMSGEATPAQISEKSELLAKVSQELGTAMYAASQAAEGSTDGEAAGGSGDSPAGGAGHDDSDVVDAEVVDEDK